MTNSTKSSAPGGAPAVGDGQRTTKIRNAIDASSLAAWMVRQPLLTELLFADNSPTDRKSELERRLEIRQFGFGQSNPTYLLTIHPEKDRNVVQLVLRRKPTKTAHPTAHALHREYRVLESLTKYNQQLEGRDRTETSSDKSVPVPKPYAYCKDASVIGAEFYVMEYVKGRIFVDPRMPSMSCPDDRRKAYQDAIRVLAVRMLLVHYAWFALAWQLLASLTSFSSLEGNP